MRAMLLLWVIYYYCLHRRASGFRAGDFKKCAMIIISRDSVNIIFLRRVIFPQITWARHVFRRNFSRKRGGKTALPCNSQRYFGRFRLYTIHEPRACVNNHRGLELGPGKQCMVRKGKQGSMFYAECTQLPPLLQTRTTISRHLNIPKRNQFWSKHILFFK